MKIAKLSMLLSLVFLVGCGDKTVECGSKFVNFAGHQVHYEVFGDGEQTVLFIHGWSCDTEFWKYQVPEFIEDYKVVLVDLPGHGGSDAPKIDYTQDYFADSIKAVLDDCKINKAVIAGHSMGFAVAWRFAIKYPKMVEAVCSVDGAYINVPEDEKEYAKWQADIDGFVNSFKGTNRAEFVSMFIGGMFTEKTTPELRKFILAKMMSTADYVGNSAMDDFVKAENWQDLPMVNVPLLAVYVKSDDLPADNRKYLLKKFKSIQYYEIDDYSHFFMLEKPELLNKKLKSFVAGLQKD